MLCDICHKNISTVHLTEIVNDKVVEMHICQACAKHKARELKEQLNISDFLGALVTGDDLLKKQKTAIKCASCGLTYNEFKKKGRLGCGKCYDALKGQLLPLLKKIHGSTRHNGKSPFVQEKKPPSQVTAQELKRRLNQAIRLEEYEEAARLRDQIREFEEKKKNV